jgi:hypothetical protein
MALAAISHITSEVIRIGKALSDVTGKIVGIIQAQSRLSKISEQQEEKIKALQEAIVTLRAREEILLASAGQTAAQIAALTASDLARRIWSPRASGSVTPTHVKNHKHR